MRRSKSVLKSRSVRFVAGGLAAAVFAALAMPSASMGVVASETGVSAREIVIGSTLPLTGPASPGYNQLAPAAKAYFDHLNKNGGVNGRRVKFVYYDDKYSPAETKKVTKQLILGDKIFAMFNALGTPPHSAVIDDLNRRGIPDVFVNTGYSGFDNVRKYPTTFPYFPSYVVESKVMAYYIQNTPELASLRPCLLYQSGEFGDNARAGFKAAGLNFVSEQSYFSGQQTAGFGPQVTAMASAGCQLAVFFGITSATRALLATAQVARWNPKFMVTSVAADNGTLAGLGVTNAQLEGIYTPSFLPLLQDTSNRYVAETKAIVEGAGLPWNFYTFYGASSAYVLAQAIKAAGPNLTRKGLINVLQTQSRNLRTPGVVPLIYSKTSHQGYNGYYMGQYKDGQLTRVTDYVITADNSLTNKATRGSFTQKPPTAKMLP
jgi:branched-chain amino acid transport system substrate-binding protein